MSKKVSDILPKTEILAQLAEEASDWHRPREVAPCVGWYEPDTEERCRVRNKSDRRNCRCDKCD